MSRLSLQKAAPSLRRECSSISGLPRIRRRAFTNIRRWVQVGFASLCVWIGVEFYFFVKYLDSGGLAGSSYRPPGVEGFLPIGSLMGLYHFFLSGEIHPVHPAGMFILTAVVTVSLVFGKSFCSWICPVGLISETLGNLGDKLFGRRIKLPRWLDYPLRSIKYLLLGFFVYSIFFLMTPAALVSFLDSPYNVVADIKMYYFFADVSRLTLVVILTLFILSIVIRNFWCRYLCPYGALLGILSLLSLSRIKRNAVNCTNCGECAGACPSFIKVNQVRTVVSDECTSCLKCVDSCPVPQTLALKSLVTGWVVPGRLVALGVVGIFVLIAGVGMATGHWHSSTTTEEYLEHQDGIHSYDHPRGKSDISTLNDEAAGAGK